MRSTPSIRHMRRSSGSRSSGCRWRSRNRRSRRWRSCGNWLLSGAVDLLVVDSAAALVPEIELQTGIGESGAGAQSRVLASGLRKLAAALRDERRGGAVSESDARRARRRRRPAGGPPLKLFAAVRISLQRGARRDAFASGC